MIEIRESLLWEIPLPDGDVQMHVRPWEARHEYEIPPILVHHEGHAWVTDGIRFVRLCEQHRYRLIGTIRCWASLSSQLLGATPGIRARDILHTLTEWLAAPAESPAPGAVLPAGKRRRKWPNPDEAVRTLIITGTPGAKWDYVGRGKVARVSVGGAVVAFVALQWDER